jgi:ABC-2 type transport system ATP-binding protein
MLAARGVVKRYGERRALDGFDLSVAPGEIVGLVGHNGAGKTTFVEVVTGLVRPDAGQVRVGGVDVRSDPRAARKLLGVAPQEIALYVGATVRDNLRLFAALAGLRRAARHRAVDRVAEELQLTGVLGQHTGLLSGGQRRRTQAAVPVMAALLAQGTLRACAVLVGFALACGLVAAARVGRGAARSASL